MADILIRGMEMPKSCGFCELRFFDGDADCCPFVGDACWYGTRHVDCPLHELPEHGDLISLEDALIDADERAYDFWTSDDEANGTKQFLLSQPVIVPSNKEETE